MASWIVHLRIAGKLLKRFPALDEKSFFVGNIAPDCGLPTDNPEVFDPPQKITHFLAGKGKSTADPERFRLEYIDSYNGDKSFYLGYYSHLRTDLLWSRLIGNPAKEKYKELYLSDRLLFWQRIKADWYDLDHLFVRENPNFRGLAALREAEDFDNIYLDFFSKEAIPTQIAFINTFYSSTDHVLDREYPYLTKVEMDDFVNVATEEIAELLKKLVI